MVQQVDPFVYPIPKKFLSDPELRPYFEYFHRWAHDMWKRTGGSSDDVADTGLRETYPWLQEHNTDDQQQTVYNVETPVVQLITKTISRETYTAVDNMFINATNNSTLLLPANPIENSQVDFTKDKTKLTLKGNGKKVNGTTQDIIFKKERLGRQIRYFIDVDEWFFI